MNKRRFQEVAKLRSFLEDIPTHDQSWTICIHCSFIPARKFSSGVHCTHHIEYCVNLQKFVPAATDKKFSSKQKKRPVASNHVEFVCCK